MKLLISRLTWGALSWSLILISGRWLLSWRNYLLIGIHVMLGGTFNGAGGFYNSRIHVNGPFAYSVRLEVS